MIPESVHPDVIYTPVIAILMTDIGGGRVANNNFKDNATGGLIALSALGLEINGNVLSGSANGMFLSDCSELNVHHNTLSGNGTGIQLTGMSGTTNSTLDWNHCAGNSIYGIWISAGSSGNIYSHNRTPGNGTAGINDAGTNTNGGNNF